MLKPDIIRHDRCPRSRFLVCNVCSKGTKFSAVCENLINTDIFFDMHHATFFIDALFRTDANVLVFPTGQINRVGTLSHGIWSWSRWSRQTKSAACTSGTTSS